MGQETEPEQRREGLSGIINPLTGEEYRSTTPAPVEEPQPETPKRDIEPGPGQVLIQRKPIARTVRGIEKPTDKYEDEVRRNRWATVLRVGAAHETMGTAWFDVGDEVWVNWSLVDEEELENGQTVSFVPFSGVKARWVNKDWAERASE
jgi:hypothetical protein